MYIPSLGQKKNLTNMLSKGRSSNPKTLRFVEELSEPLNWMRRNHQTIIVVDLKCFASIAFLKYVSPKANETHVGCTTLGDRADLNFNKSFFFTDFIKRS